jgi:hypothetical protein
VSLDPGEWRDINKDVRRGGWLIAKVIIAFVVLIAVIAIGWTKFVSPALLDTEAENFRESHSYVETQRTFLLQKLSAIQEIEAEIADLPPESEMIPRKEAQIKAFTREIQERVELIDEKEVPQSVLDYLEEVTPK